MSAINAIPIEKLAIFDDTIGKFNNRKIKENININIVNISMNLIEILKNKSIRVMAKNITQKLSIKRLKYGNFEASNKPPDNIKVETILKWFLEIHFINRYSNCSKNM
jgi:hypothetical protein